MQIVYEAPELVSIGDADDVVLGTPGGAGDALDWNAALDFEFEQD